MSVTAAHQNIAELYVRAELNAYSETFRVLKEKETRLYNEYCTKRLVLEAWKQPHYINTESFQNKPNQGGK